MMTGMPKKVPVVAATLLLAGGLSYLAIPRTIAAVLAIPGNVVLENIQTGRTVSKRDLNLLIKSREDVLRWVDSGRYRTDLGLAWLLLAEGRGGDAEYDGEKLAIGLQELKTGLAKAPARPYVWTRLALVELLISGPSPTVDRAMHMSILTDPYNPKLLSVRLQLAFEAWESLSDVSRTLVHEQIRLAWRRAPDELVQIAVETERTDIIRSSLENSVGDLTELERRMQLEKF